MEKKDSGMDWNISGRKAESAGKTDNRRKRILPEGTSGKTGKKDGVGRTEKNRTGKRWSAKKKLAVVFCVGALLCGIGTGVSLVEYSSFEYLGEKPIGGGKTETKVIEEELYRGKNGNGKVYVHSYYGDNTQAVLETSKEVPKDKIQFVVEYNPNNVKEVFVDREELEGNDPYYYGYYDSYYGDVEYAETDFYADEDSPEEGTAVEAAGQTGAAEGGQNTDAAADRTEPQSYITYMVDAVFAQNNGLEIFFTYKDEILRNLKEKRFYEYEYNTVESVKVLVHPSNKDVVSLY